MNGFAQNSLFFGAALSLAAYFVGAWLKKKLKSSLANPLLIAIIITVSVLLIGKIDYESYNQSAKYISWLLTPATVCLAIPLYRQFEVLKKNAAAVLAGIITGVLGSIVCVLALSLLFGFSHAEYATFLPKSITTAIGMAVSEELGGIVSVTVVMIIVTGVLGNVIAPFVLKLFGITEPVAKGVALGTASHAIGTARAMEMGQVEGAMSSLSIVVAGLLTVVLAPLFSGII